MKSLIKILCLFLTISGLAQETSTTRIIFGRYGGQGNECSSGRGACSFSVTPIANLSKELISLRKISNNAFKVLISRKMITNEDEINIAGKAFNEIMQGELTSFVQNENINLDQNTLRSLGIDSQYSVLSKGSYNLSVSNEQIELIFVLARPSK